MRTRSQIRDAIIREVSVHMTDLVGRALAVDIQPGEPVCLVLDAVDMDGSACAILALVGARDNDRSPRNSNALCWRSQRRNGGSGSLQERRKSRRKAPQFK